MEPGRGHVRRARRHALRHAGRTQSVEIVEAAHPVPDEAGLQAAKRILALARDADPDDLVVCLMSGGASALLSLPADGVALADKQDLNPGAAEIRRADRRDEPRAQVALGHQRRPACGGRGEGAARHLSDLGRSGRRSVQRTVPAHHTGARRPDVALILRKYGIDVPAPILQVIRSNAVTEPFGGTVHMLATPKMALDAAAAKAREFGLTPLVLGDALEGEARGGGRVMAGIARSALMHSEPRKITLRTALGRRDDGDGSRPGAGRAQCGIPLALALALKDETGIAAIACDTDGIDGSEDNAGAWFDGSLFDEARSKGVDLAAHLETNAYTAFAQLDRLIVTGPTLTNVNDFRCILIRS